MKSLFFGVVEDRLDPLMLGRCRVRIVGVHTEDKVILPTEDLAWAMPMQPITSAGISGIGTAPVGVVEGTWVVVIFIDENMQYPLMIGTVGGYNENLPFEFDNQATTNSVKDYDVKLSSKPANEGEDKKDAGGLETVIPLDKILGALPAIDMPAIDVANAFEEVNKEAFTLDVSSVTTKIMSADEINAKYEAAQSSLGDKLTAASEKLKAEASAGIDNIETTAVTFGNSLLNKATSAVSELVSGVTDKITNLATNLTTAASGLMTAAKSKYDQLAKISDSIDPDAMMKELKTITNQAGEKAQAGVDNAAVLISSGAMQLSDLKTEAEKQDVVKMIQDKVTDLPDSVQSYIISSGASVEEQYNIIKQFAENGISMYSDPKKEYEMVVTSTTTKIASGADVNAEYEAKIKAGL